MRILLQGLALAALSACSATTAATDLSRSDAIVTSDERLTLTVADAPTRPGIMFVAGTVVGGQGKVVVSSTRYGSVCATNITAHADVGQRQDHAGRELRGAHCSLYHRLPRHHIPRGNRRLEPGHVRRKCRPHQRRRIRRPRARPARQSRLKPGRRRRRPWLWTLTTATDWPNPWLPGPDTAVLTVESATYILVGSPMRAP